MIIYDWIYITIVVLLVILTIKIHMQVFKTKVKLAYRLV